MIISENRDKVVHNYRDRAQEPDPVPASGAGQTGVGLDANFPTKLHYALSMIEGDGQSNVISWQPHGRCFMVHDMKTFVDTMLPMWFRQSKFASFQRQLNLYGFQRITQGRDKNAYYHEYFLRGRPLLAQKIIRTKVKGRGARKASSPETEPKFYDLPWMPEASLQSNVQETTASPSASTQLASPSLTALTHLAPTPIANPSPAPAVVNPAMTAYGQHSQNMGDAHSLADALALFGNSSLAQVMSAQMGQQVYQGSEPMFLPSFTQDVSPSSLNALLSSFAPAPAPVESNSTSMSSKYVPIAPAPLTQEGEPFKPLDTNNNYSSVLSALKVQHNTAGPTDAEGSPTQSFTVPGPVPF